MKQWIKYIYRIVRHGKINPEKYGCKEGVLTWCYLNAIWGRRWADKWTPVK